MSSRAITRRAGVTRTRAASRGQVRFVDVLKVRVFRVVYSAELQSGFGDQLARVALSVLVFAQTGSDSATALTYALTYLPAVVGGFVLAGVGDRFPRRSVMIGCDVLRAAAYAAMAISGLPLLAVGALLFVAVFVGPAFSASAASLLAAELDQEQFRAASGVRMASSQLIQVVGFGAGGVLVAVLGSRQALALNAATYVVSATALAIGLRGRARVDGARIASAAPDRSPVLAVVLKDVRARSMLILALLAGCFVVPESLAIPFAAQIGATTSQAGLLLAAIPFGAMAGILVVTRLAPPRNRIPVAWAMAVATGVPLVATAASPPLPVVALCWFGSGMASAYIVEAIIVLVNATSDSSRSRLLSVVSSLLLGAQGLGPIVFGLLGSVLSPGSAVAWAGATGTVAAALTVGFAVSRTARVGAHRPAA